MPCLPKPFALEVIAHEVREAARCSPTLWTLGMDPARDTCSITTDERPRPTDGWRLQTRSKVLIARTPRPTSSTVPCIAHLSSSHRKSRPLSRADLTARGVVHVASVLGPCDVIESFGKLNERPQRVAACEGLAVARDDEGWVKRCESLNRMARCIPVGREIRRWAMEFWPLRGDGEK